LILSTCSNFIFSASILDSSIAFLSSGSSLLVFNDFIIKDAFFAISTSSSSFEDFILFFSASILDSSIAFSNSGSSLSVFNDFKDSFFAISTSSSSFKDSFFSSSASILDSSIAFLSSGSFLSVFKDAFFAIPTSCSSFKDSIFFFSASILDSSIAFLISMLAFSFLLFVASFAAFFKESSCLVLISLSCVCFHINSFFALFIISGETSYIWLNKLIWIFFICFSISYGLWQTACNLAVGSDLYFSSHKLQL